MTGEVLGRANKIQEDIENLVRLRYMASKSYKRFKLVKKMLWMSDYEEIQVVVCDEGLTNLIKEYCDKRIKELHEELKQL